MQLQPRTEAQSPDRRLDWVAFHGHVNVMSTHDEPRLSLLRTTTSCEKSSYIASCQSHDEQAQVQSKRPPVDGNGAAEPIAPGSLNDNSTPASAAMYLDDYTLAAALHKNTTSMSSDRSSTITVTSPVNSPSSPVKPSFRISLPSGLSLLGLAIGKCKSLHGRTRPYFTGDPVHRTRD